jgi:DNA-binding NarL/FixJ family response regulator
VAHGEAIFSPSVVQRLIGFFAAPRSPALAQSFPDLTEQEREVLTLLAQDYTNAALGERLVLSTQTVRNYVSTIFARFQVADRAEAISKARDAGMVGGE